MICWHDMGSHNPAGVHPLAGAAADLVGTTFRLHGRDPATGLDCVGLVCAALATIGAKPVAPRGYSLRNLAVDQWLYLAEQSGLVPSSGLIRSGDVLLVALGACQHHLAIAENADSIIHAHAGLRKVVRQRRAPDWRICSKWRIPSALEG
jgi:cell wall-associated NlpC family hydrolase